MDNGLSTKYSLSCRVPVYTSSPAGERWRRVAERNLVLHIQVDKVGQLNFVLQIQVGSCEN